MFRGLNFTKHCNAQKFQNFREHGPGLDINARILEFLEFFEHYRVSSDWGLEILEFFEHYSVSCTPCGMIHECVGVDLGGGGGGEHIYTYTDTPVYTKADRKPRVSGLQTYFLYHA